MMNRGAAHIQSSLAVYHDISLVPGGSLLDAATLRANVIVTSPGVITLPSILSLIHASFTPGSQYTFTTDFAGDGLVTIVPDPADSFTGFGTGAVLQPGSANSVTIELDIPTSPRWRFVNRTGMQSRSISAPFVAPAVSLLPSDIRDTIILAPTALQFCALPSVAAMLLAGFLPGQTISIVKGAEAFASTIAPDPLDSIVGGNLILPADVESGVILQMPATGGGAWESLAAPRPGRSTTAPLAVGAGLVLTKSTIRDTTKLVVTAVSILTLPKVSDLLAAGYRIGQIFCFVKDSGLFVLTIEAAASEGGAAGFFGIGATPTLKSGPGGSVILQMPDVGGLWLILSQS